MNTLFIIGYVLTYILHLYLLYKWTGELDSFYVVFGLICPPAAIAADFYAFKLE